MFEEHPLAHPATVPAKHPPLALEPHGDETKAELTMGVSRRALAKTAKAAPANGSPDQ